MGFPTTDILNWSYVASRVVNNLQPKPKKKEVSIATRKFVDHLEALHACGDEPSHMLVWPDYNCQKNYYYLAAYKVSYSVFL